MTAYFVADIEVTDPKDYEGYKEGAATSVAAFGGRYLARGGKSEVLEGAWAPKRLVIIEFPTMERLRAWYGSPEYRTVLGIRQRASVSKAVIVEGLPQ